MITEDYVSFEVAKLLKEKGFVTPCDWMYCSDGTFGHRNSLWDKEMFLAPTHQMAMKWLREHGFHITIIISYDYSADADGNEVDRWTFYIFEIHSSFSGELIYAEEIDEYDSYEEAVESALKYALEKLI